MIQTNQMINTLSYRPTKISDLRRICFLPQNEEELFFMFPKADYPLSVEQLQTVLENRSDSTVILLDDKVVGFANFYEVKENEYCSIGNVIVNSNFRNKGNGFSSSLLQEYSLPACLISPTDLMGYNPFLLL